MDNDTEMQALDHAEQLKRPRGPFDALYRVDCSKHIEKKNGFSYLSWPFAVAELRKHVPDATWRVIRDEAGNPFRATECGYFVEVAVTVDGIELSQIHPVLDHRNKPVPQPDAFHINTSIQRCLVKAIALHGLGLSIYAGEDVPPDVVEDRKAEAAKPISDEQAANIEALIQDVGADRAAFLRHFKIAALPDLPAKDYDRAVKALQSKRKAA